MAKNKFYAIRKGHEVGVFEGSWDEVNTKYIKGFSGSEYKGFSNKDDAMAWVNSGQPTIVESDVPKEIPIIYVDGSYMNEVIGYGLVYTKCGEEVFRDAGRVILGASLLSEIAVEDNGNLGKEDPRNVAGEIYGAIRAIQVGIANKDKEIVIGYDYKGIECWVTGSWTAKSVYSKRYVEYVNSTKDKINVKFIKISAHSSHKFNEIADGLAKLGTTL